jgi:hypothetical protein
MKTNGKHEVIARIAGPGLVLASLLAMVLASSIAGRAQSSTTSPVVPAAAPTKAVPAVQPAAPAKRQPGGNHEGIHVHGHWTIEVRNPDGRLVSHTEFENSLVQLYGAESLTALLAGYAVPGGYRVRLASDSVKDTGPCTGTGQEGTDDWCVLVGSLISPEPAAFGDNFSQCGGTGFSSPNGSTYPITATGPCFPLSISTSGSAGSLTFMGTAVASTAVNVTDVFLDPLVCPYLVSAVVGGAAASPNSCATGSGAYPYQGLTHATLPTAVTISAAGQFISVNVQLSFQ